ncbi:sigma-70 family RNA polymerase sigma factor [Geomicrobium sp. JCM 19055]|uniref:sigma-70 family RNA polymerase sigma factor n=1 Tax=Geomicrobium sp. JCM 19055 TaxID=1460649 RepID=UPI0005A7FDF4|nr:sigma-70 family RNA polymerase sigma factor [Geomicrobium sp. JCM 19055]
MTNENKYERQYKLHTVEGVKRFYDDLLTLKEARFFGGDFELSDMLLDFDSAVERCLTKRQKQITELYYLQGLNSLKISRELSITHQTILEHLHTAYKNLASYHLLERNKYND